MSSSEEENFNLDVSGSESDDYAPTTKKVTKAPAKKVTKTAAAKPPAKKAAPKKKVLVDKDDNADDSIMVRDEDSADESSPARPAAAAPSRKQKTASETYTKLTQLEHILKRPDSYIGSVESISQAMWTWDSENKRMVHREVKYVPGFFKIVDEILVNAADNKINDSSMDTIKVNINVEEGTISVHNNGKGIPIEMHSKEKMYIPELIFGHLLSSSNYDDDEKKLTGGRNGFGAKLANIYSHEFTIDTADKKTGQKYKQTWTDNMSKVGKAKITKNSRDEEYTKVSFKPDLARFGMDSIDDDAISLLKRRVYDMAGTVKDVKVYLNDERLKIKNFKQYCDMYLESATADAAESSGGAVQAKPTILYEKINNRWEVAFAVSEGTFQQVSFANSIATIKGGTHVNLIADQLAKALITDITKKNKAASVKPAQIKNHMWIFVNALIENPTFDSQTKETLTLPSSKFGSRPHVSEEFLKKVSKSAIVEHVLNWAKFKADQQIKKTDGTKRNRLTGLTKLADANNAGTRKAEECTLILTEGDSAKALAVAGLGVVGRDNFGVFPLRGKLLNVREAKHDQIMKNEEIQNIKKIMGLQHNKEYSNIASLRYGKLMIMADQDHDGSHIKGLLINFLDHFYPSLLKIPNFLVEFVTPIVRVSKGKQRKDFFTIPEYEQWLEDTPDAHKWDSKYFKGLGTSSDADARYYFGNMRKHMIPFAATQDGDRQLIDLAFSKKKADDRKEWLRQFKPGTYLDHNIDEIPYSDFINKELILFSMADNVRSIPSIADGLKPGQRKVIWGCFKRKLKKEIKVAQLVGYISEVAAYHHGEQSLMATIVNLAQDYVGSNNVNLLMPNGQFGTRDQGGKDHASARYIFTELSPLTRSLFNPADDPILSYLKEDNDWIEPEFYMPTIPLVLINGADGIGTGWSTTIPCYNPEDIVANIRRLMAGEEMVTMTPWWRGFKGEIKKSGENKYEVTGIARKVDDTTIEITELPVWEWTQSFKAKLEGMIGEKGEGDVKDYKEHHDNVNVHFVVTMSAKGMAKAEEQGLIEFFKLSKPMSTTNMMCFNFEGKITKYKSPEDIIDEFYPKRLAYYQKRKDHLANDLQNQFEKLSNQARFVQMIVDKELSVSNRRKDDIIADLRKHNFRSFPKVVKAKAIGETEDVVEQPDEDDDVDKAGHVTSTDFDYLLGMAIYSLTKERIQKLLQQAGEKEKELLALLERTPIEIWNEDLDGFLKEWEKSCEDFRNKSLLDANGKPIKRKQTKLQHRKSIGGRKGGSDSEDDFKPTKAAAKKKATEPKPKPKPVASSSKLESDDDKPVVKKAAAAKKAPKKEESNEDISLVAAPKRAAAAKKTYVPVDSDEDEDASVVPAPKRAAAAKKPALKIDSDDEDISAVIAPPKRAAAKKSAIKIDSDDDEDLSIAPPPKKPAKLDSDSEMEVPLTKGKGKAKAESSKRKSPDSGDDDSKPPKKKQASVTDFFGKGTAPLAAAAKKTAARKTSGSSKPASKPKAAPAKKKKAVDSDGDDDDELGGSVVQPDSPVRAAPKRATRGKTKTYIEIESGSENEDSMFVDDDD